MAGHLARSVFDFPAEWKGLTRCRIGLVRQMYGKGVYQEFQTRSVTSRV